MRFTKILLVCLGVGLVGWTGANRPTSADGPRSEQQRLCIVADGGDPLPRPPLFADGGDPLPRPPLVADGGDPLPRPPQGGAPVFDGGDPLPRPPAAIRG